MMLPGDMIKAMDYARACFLWVEPYELRKRTIRNIIDGEVALVVYVGQPIGTARDALVITSDGTLCWTDANIWDIFIMI